MAWILLVLAALNFGCVALLPSDGGGETEFEGPRKIVATDIALPDGYCADSLVRGLTYPTSVTQDEQGNLYVVEAGYSYGESFAEPRLLKIDGNKQTEIATGKQNGPWTGAVFHKGAFYLSEGGVMDGGRILRVMPDGKTTTLVSSLPSKGDHHTNQPVIGPDGWVYFGVGTATNSGVVGDDNLKFGWAKRDPKFHDVPCQDVVLRGRNFPAAGALATECGKAGSTGAFSPLCTATKPNQIITGQIPCSGAVLRVRPSGGAVELVAWGFRNPFGLAFGSNDELFVTDNGYDERGSRPVYGAGDLIWRIEKGKWYGWPDFSGGISLSDRRFHQGLAKDPGLLLARYPNQPPKPVATLGVHSSSNGLDISGNEEFGYVGQAFVAQFGDMAPDVGKVVHPVGFRVSRVDLKTGVIEDFAVNKRTSGPASKEKSGGLERPVDVQFSRDGRELFVVDFGVLTMGEAGPVPHEGTGVVWRIRRGECAAAH